MTIKNLSQAVNSIFVIDQDMKLTVVGVQTDVTRPDRTMICLRHVSTSPILKQQQKLHARFGKTIPIMAMTEAPVPPLGGPDGPQFHVYGSDGNLMTISSISYNALDVDGLTLVVDITLTLHGSSPLKLVMIGSKTFTVRAPFRLKDLPLPLQIK